MPRCAIYARFSTDLQSQTSADDQVRICRERATREGWTVAGEPYLDLAISGANARRPGMTQMLADAAAGSFEIVLAEALDRIARDQEFIAGTYKRLRFAGVRLVTLTEGEVNELHIGLKGTMDALELKKMADKIRRGQRGAVSRGRVSGGLCYGYELAPEMQPDGTVQRGLRRIVEDEAVIVRRIYAEYLKGRSPKAIAKDLNRQGVPSPSGGEWRPSSIVGSGKRQIGILRNAIYFGRIVYGRVAMARNPDTSRRVSRIAPTDQHEVTDVPHLAIVTSAEWDAVQAMFEERAGAPLHAVRRPRRLLSGLVRCGVCQGSYTVIGSERWGCSRHRDVGTCSNLRTITTRELEARVLAGLKEKLLSPEAVKFIVREYHLRRERLVKESVRSRDVLVRRMEAHSAAIRRLVAAIADGGDEFPEVRDLLRQRRAERDALEAELSETDALPVIALHPGIAAAYRKRIEALAIAFGGSSSDEELAHQVRALIDVVRITPRPERGCDIDVLGSLHAVIAVAEDRQPSRKRGDFMRPLVAEEPIARTRSGHCNCTTFCGSARMIPWKIPCFRHLPCRR